MKQYTPLEAICFVMGWEYSEAKEYRYQPTRTSHPIYSTADGYVCACKDTRRFPPKRLLKEFSGCVFKPSQTRTPGQTVWLVTPPIVDGDRYVAF